MMAEENKKKRLLLRRQKTIGNRAVVMMAEYSRQTNCVPYSFKVPIESSACTIFKYDIFIHICDILRVVSLISKQF